MGSMSVSSCRCCMFMCILWQFSMLQSMPFAVFSNATPFLYSSLLKGYTMEVSPSVAGGSTGCFGCE